MIIPISVDIWKYKTYLEMCMWTCGHTKTMLYFTMIKTFSPKISVPKFQFWKEYFQRKDCGHIHLRVSLRNIF